MNQNPNQNTCPNPDRLADYCLGKLEVVEMEKVEHHLEACATCQDTINHLDLKADTIVVELRSRAQADPLAAEPGLQQALAGAMQLPLVPSPAAEPAFDAYHEWLGIPPTEQPPNHYRLLGLAKFEKNANAIEHAADRQMSHIRKFQAGKHAADATRLLNEIAKASRCLLTVAEKKKYDAELRVRTARAIAESSPPVAPVVAPDKWPDGQTTVTADDFLRCLVASGLMERAAADKVIESLAPPHRPTDSKACASLFVQRNLLTPFQARALYQGKPHGLIVADREILELLGKGGMGNVYKVRYRRLDRIEALKLILPKKLDSEEARQRLLREARATARLNHPNVVSTFDGGEEDGVHFLAMEFVDGSDLARTVKDHGPMSVDQAVACILQAAAGLEAAHTAGIIHRDIKPHNLLLDRAGVVKVLDLGLARFTDTHASLQAQKGLTQSGQVMGTVDYMSPEQTLDVRKVTPASDVYSLGCTLHYLLTGKPPFHAAESLGEKMMAHHHQPIPSLCATRADVTPELDAVFQKMLAKNPAERIATMVDVILALKNLGSSAAPVPPPVARDKTLAEDSKLDVFLSLLAQSQDLPTPRGAGSIDNAPTQLHQPQAKPSAQKKKQKPCLTNRTFPLILAAAAIFLGMLGAVITFSIRTPQGEVQVAIAPEYADEVKVIVSQGGKTIHVDKQNDWNIKLDRGQYSVALDPQSKSKFTLDKQSVSVSAKQTEVVRVTLIPAKTELPGVPVPTSTVPMMLSFDGDDYIDIANFKYDGSHPLTFEARFADQAPAGFRTRQFFSSITPAIPNGFNTSILLTHHKLKPDDASYRNEVHVNQGTTSPRAIFNSGWPIEDGVFKDLAVVMANADCQIFVNGRRTNRGTFTFGSHLSKLTVPFARIGNLVDSTNSARGFRGHLHHVRISKSARYAGAYVPPANLEADADTLLLYRFDQATGNVAKDLSSNKLDGKIVGAKWIPVSDMVPPLPLASIAPADGLSPDRRAAELVLRRGGKVQVYVKAGNNQTISDIEKLPAETFSLLESNLLQRKLMPNDLEVFSGCLRLQFLDLGGTNVDDGSLRPFASLTNLRTLSLWGTQITDASLPWVGGQTNLQRLYLQNTKIRDDGLKNLEGLQKLFYLDLNAASITDGSIAHLTKLTALKELYLHGTKLSPSGLAQLRQALPNCKIESSVQP